jgi:hypothetical protein
MRQLTLALLIFLGATTFAMADASVMMCFEKKDMLIAEKAMYEKHKESLIFSGVNVEGVYFQMYAGANSWTVFFLTPENTFCTCDRLHGDTVSLSSF